MAHAMVALLELQKVAELADEMAVHWVAQLAICWVGV